MSESPKTLPKKVGTKTIKKEPASPKPAPVESESPFTLDDSETVTAPAPVVQEVAVKTEPTPDAPVEPSPVASETPSVGEKRKVNPVEPSQEAKKAKPATLKYIPWQFLTRKVLDECVKFGDLYCPPGKAGIMKIQFDYERFGKLCPDCPRITPAKSKVLYSNHPMLKSSFGYSPYEDEQGKIANQLRFEFDDFVCDDARTFKTHIIEEWNPFFPVAIFKNKSKFKDRYLESRCKVGKNEEITETDIIRAFKSVVREPEKSSFADYIQFKLETQREKPGIQEADPYTAFINIWTFRTKDDQGNPIPRKCLAKKLTQKNSTDYDGTDAEIIFGKGMYGEGLYSFEHISFTKDAIGLTFQEHNLVIASREDFASDTSEENEEECPL